MSDGYMNEAVEMARYHHEKWDGSGYPEHLAGEAIPLCARIMAIADVFDALVSPRVYKSPMSYDEAFKIIEEESGIHFDPVVAQEFLNIKEKAAAINESMKVRP
jgi:HD-GYP domain-containing protein (c-di-GMP phosphodiesterase class II)